MLVQQGARRSNDFKAKGWRWRATRPGPHVVLVHNVPAVRLLLLARDGVHGGRGPLERRACPHPKAIDVRVQLAVVVPLCVCARARSWMGACVRVRAWSQREARSACRCGARAGRCRAAAFDWSCCSLNESRLRLQGHRGRNTPACGSARHHRVPAALRRGLRTSKKARHRKAGR